MLSDEHCTYQVFNVLLVMQVMQDLEAKAEVVKEQARTHNQVVDAYERINASLQLANSENHMYKTRIVQLEAEAKRDASQRRCAAVTSTRLFRYAHAIQKI